MTDNEIIKALEWCGCAECMAILDLINRQKAEIEDLNRNLMSAYSKIERLKKGWTADIVITAYAKDETIKEFVDKLCEGRVSNDPVVIAAKCLLKETTEGNP